MEGEAERWQVFRVDASGLMFKERGGDAPVTVLPEAWSQPREPRWSFGRHLPASLLASVSAPLAALPWMPMAPPSVGTRSAHLAMTDTLMMAYTVEMVSIEKVIACAQQYAAFFQATDLPYDTEDAVTYWINKVNEHLKDIMEQEQKLKEHHTVEAPGGQKARYRKEQTLLKHLPCIPLVENLLKDGSDGCALAALIHFYCPGVVRLEDICLKETMSLADSLYNLQLIQEFCQEYLNQCCHFTLEDMLYAASSIKSNYLVFMAELFWWFEVVKPSFVQPRVHPRAAEPVNDMPSTPVLNAAKRNAWDSSCASDLTSSVEGAALPHPHHHLPSGRPRPQTHSSASGGIRRSSSMSYVDGFIGTWPKEKRSSVHGVSFDISFDEESAAQRPPANRGITRSVSNEGLSLSSSRASRNIRRSLSFKPVDGEEEAGSIEEELGVGAPGHLRSPGPPDATERGAGRSRALLDECGSRGETPSIEEALQIIHDTEKPPCSPQPGQTANGFFLHSQEGGVLSASVKLRPSSPDSTADTKGTLSPVTDNTEVDTGIHVPSEDIPETLDEDSSLRDYTVSLDSDVDDAPRFLQDCDPRAGSARDALSPCPSTVSTRSQPGSSASSSSGVKMTSFAEQKFRKLNHTDGKSSGSSSQKTTPEGSELNVPHAVAWAQAPEEAGLPQGRDSTQLLASEMLHLRMRLEEKRRAIEAQKKKVEAAFTQQRQRVGRTAFLTVVRKKGERGSPMREEAAGAEDEEVFGDRAKDREAPKAGGQRGRAPAAAKDSEESPPAKWPKSPTTPVDPDKPWGLASPSEEALSEGEAAEHAKSIEKLNSSLRLLQQEMQRLSVQQELLMQMRERQSMNLIEVSLSDLKPPEKADVSVEKGDGDSDKEQLDEDQKLCCGFFFKDDQKAEDDMAVKRAALLEKRQLREKEAQLRKQRLEAELEHKKEETRRKTEEERQRKEDERARREFIRQEHMRRKQLKLMEDMDTVLKPRPQAAKQKKQRPKSIHRDHVESPKTPVRGPPASSLSLASLDTGDNESVRSGKRTPRSESVEGFLSPSRCGSRNGEKDWENASTTSSVASGTEYTGPKLYKEPSAKSNKHIIQNALAHCCLAGKVNEGQKRKILEEMEKSDANNFLILFRDSGCQFRSLYTYCPETEEISKLTGIGPKSITKKMIEGLYKYNSDRKQFSHIPAKTLSASVDAITIHSHLWQSKRPVTPKKLLPTKA
ncbi:Calmodulin-regulated spectrin-associated protein 2 [Pteropus alecto]|uniref:Calmodulin-regulated spectrin-associated protein 2 n=1 Tax=Pteropus alecto TaxID=9402 RepID=L5L6M8_PTEAL|nr:Calmodulin-regulated spectrin-associated protein 2 [Pteropus alecto]